MKKIGVLLSGCGVNDGSEIHEATLALYFLDRQGVERVCIAPDGPQTRVVDHLSGGQVDEERFMLTEAARIARGDIRPLDGDTAEQIDGLVLPGGYGAVLNWCDYATRGREMTVREDVASLLLRLHERKKPIGAMCIAPVVLARVFGGQGIAVQLTIGDNPTVGGDIEAMGAQHVIQLVDEVAVDRAHKVVSTPAYMLGENVAQIGPGIEKLVETVVGMT